MGKLKLLSLLEFPFEYHGLSNWVSFIKLFSILDVEAGMDRILDVKTGMDRLAKGHRADQKTCTWRKALSTAVGQTQNGNLLVLAHVHSRERRVVQKVRFLAGTWQWGGPESSRCMEEV